MAEWRDKSRIPAGMSDFQRWYRPEGIDPRKSPSDVDGILHNRFGNKFLMFEFKPYQGSMTVGQKITLEGFSRLPNCTGMVIYDPHSSDRSRARYGDNEPLGVTLFKHGKMQDYVWTVSRFNQEIADWFSGKGMLSAA